MKLITDLSIKSKLLLSFGLMIFFTAAVAATAYSVITAMRSTIEFRGREHKVIADLLNIRAGMNRLRGQMLEISLIKDNTGQEKLSSEVIEHTDEIKREIAALTGPGRGEGKSAAAVSELKMQWEVYEKAM